MPRYKLAVEYDGTPFVGWQSQANGRGVQDAIEAAIHRFSGETRRIQCAGRTDTGVHASGQVAHLDLAKVWRTDIVRDALNAHLKPEPVAILSAEIVPDDFNARTWATKRHYSYLILNRRAPPALDRLRAWHVPWALDAGLMNDAASLLVGRHDFTTFRSSDCQANSPLRTLDVFSVARDGEEIRVSASARSFLHHQVRSMVGTIALAGAGRWAVEEVGQALEAKSRAACGPLAPPHGLTFASVDYEPRDRAEA
jgi:tRNA pseudouridine38-40 synthase